MQRVEGRRHAVHDRHRAMREHRRVQAWLDGRANLGNFGGAHEATRRDRFIHCITDGDVLGLLEVGAARGADGHVVRGRQRQVSARRRSEHHEGRALHILIGEREGRDALSVV